MEDETFRDYYKAENTDDEEANHDLQSHLYSKIYYVSNDIDIVDEKPDIEFKSLSSDNKELLNRVNTSGVNPQKEEVKNNDTDNYVTSGSALFDEDTKSNIKSICLENQIGTSVERSQNYLNVSCALQHSQENVATSQDEGSTSQNTEITNNLNSSNISRDVGIKPKAEEESEIELKSTNSNFEINESKSQSHSKSINSNVDSGIEEIQEVNTVKLKDDHGNILKRYEFSKLFINKLYQEKYVNLQKQLQKLDKENEMNLKQQEEEGKIKLGENQQLYTCTNPISDEESNSKYNVCTRSKKRRKVNDYSEEQVILLTSDTETDSEGSILEVPIPPKPKPPVINLQDSDDSETFSNNNDTDECSLIENNKKVSHTRLKKKNSSNDRLRNDITEDIILNCSEVRKGASSIKEIREMSKNVQNKSKECRSKNKDDSGKDKSISISTICSRNLDDARKSLSSSEKDNIPECDVSLEATSNRSIVFERDKNQSVTSMEDVTNFEIPNQPSSSRKRQRINDDEDSVSTKQKKYLSSKDSSSPACINEQDKGNNETVWEEYFFRPMSDKIKAFYNESRGQENFNVEEIQSKMSKDPRLWAVLDDDMMPNFGKGKRFWNVKCNNCNKEGHQTYNCTEPRKPPRCHMCGTQGHTERKCPKKMCLTCGKSQGTFRKTCEFCCTLYCDMCRAIGHESTECPDHWRRFHQTTQNSEIRIPENLSEVMKPPDLLFCCNCTQRGHDSSTCHDYRWSQHFPTPAFVTNYTDVPLCKKQKNTTSEDVIPLKKSTNRKKERKTVTTKIVERKDDLQNCSILYKYGTFEPTRKDGQEICKLLDGNIFKTNNFLDGFEPTFLSELLEKVSFELIIYRTQNQTFARIRALSGVPLYIYKIFEFWMKLDKRDKQSLKLYINLPYDAKKLYNMFTAKWEEMEQVSADPYALCKQIQSLQSSMSGACDPSILHTISDRVRRLRGKLLNLYNRLVSNWPEMLRQITKRLHKCSNNNKKRCLTDNVYCRSMYLYNESFLPRILTNKEVDDLFKQYHKLNTEGERKEKPKKKKKSDKTPYEKFILFERSTGKRKKETATSSNFIPEQNEEILTCTSTQNVSQEQSEKIISCPSTENISQEPNKKIPNCTSSEKVSQERNNKITSCAYTENVIQEQNKKIPTSIDTENVTEIQIINVPTCTSTKGRIQEQCREIPICTTTENVVQEKSKKSPVFTTIKNDIQEQSKKRPIWVSSETNVQCNDTFSVCPVERTNWIRPTEHVQLENTIKQGHETNVTVTSLKKSTKSHIILQQSGNNSEKNIESAKNNNIPQASSSKKGTVRFAEKINWIRPIEHVQLENTIKQGHELNLTVTSSKKPTKSHIILQQSDNNSEKNIESAKNNNIPQASSSKKGTVVFDSTSKKKKKKREKSESNTEITKKEETNINISIEDRAQKVINEALKFNLPYMNDAVEEIKKRISDKNIKQEQIDVLQRLINLETDHQQYVSSFCNYLK
ncbi:uncharacterized protein LOC117219401 [Megalopta genalis]|uniref:uncharacterized protein LOC117219401 n=1 Tax=Megalopta genalis TaxID=115081 RepID=UPI003FCFF63D